MDTKQILGVRIDNLSLDEAKNTAAEFFNRGGQHRIFTPNPEMLVKARKDVRFKEVLNRGDINLCDGFGLSLFSGAKKITGVDFMIELCEMAAGQGRSVYLLGSGSDDVVKKTAEELLKKFPLLKISGFDKGPLMRENTKDGQMVIDGINNQTAIDRINQACPDILFVAFGMGKQEKWIDENLSKMPGVKIAMGVGGSFDYISGSIDRAPCWMRKIGLEWAYRLVKQPGRIGRIFNATIKFTFFALKEKL